MQAQPLRNAGQARLVDHARGFGPAHAHRVLQRPFEQHRYEEQENEVDEQCRDHLVDAEANLEQSRDQQHESAGQHCGDRHERQQQRAGPVQQARAHHRDDQRARIKLRLGADVPQPRTKGDGDGKAGEDQWCGAVQRLQQGKLAAERAFDDEAQHGKRVGPGEHGQ